MPEEEKKGFKIVDRRGVEKEDAGKEESAPPPPPRGDDGNRTAPESVQGGKRPGGEPSPVGGPSFLDLVLSVQMGAMVHLGMVQAGDGRRSPVDLPAAKDSIDLLEILKEKTKGNLTEEESGVLSEGLYHLRMTYVAAIKAGVSAPKAGQGPEGERK